jgi:uncharacterized protein (TIGR02300 family)
VAKTELGTKRLCAGCSAKFYDLGKDPAVCPTCETVYVEPKIAQSRGGRSGFNPKTVYDPHNQNSQTMGALKETDAPAVADEDEVKEGADDVLETEDDDEADAAGVPMLEELDEK